MWGGFGTDKCPCARCSGGRASYKMAVNAHNELGVLLLARAGFSGSAAVEEYLECRLNIASSMRAAS